VILAIDFGTSNLKAALINKDGIFFNYYTQEVQSEIDRDICQISSNIYLDFTTNYINSIDASKVEAIILSSNGPSFIPLLSDIKIRNNSFSCKSGKTRLWMDKRGSKYSKRVSEFYHKYIDGSFFLPSILNIKENEKDLYNKTIKFLTIDGFVNFALTKKAYTVNNADGLKDYYWNEDSLNHFNLDKSKFTDFIKCGEIIGNVDKEVADKLNLKKDVKVIAGGSDFYFSIIGSKVNRENILVDINGTSEGLNLCSSKPLIDNRFLCYEHPLDNLYNISGVLSNSGVALNWLRKILNIEDLDFEEVYELSKKAKKNSLIFLPYLNGERAPIWNPNATATLFNLTVDSSKEDIANAVIEGTIFAFKSVLEILESYDYKIDEIHVTTAKKESDYYHQLKSDITNRTFVVYNTKSAELLGLSLLAYTSLKQYPNLKTAIEKLSLNKKVFIPNKSKQEYFIRKYKLFNSVYEQTNKLMSKSF
jgi:sugar (pentulose or hexulose) kinase